MIACEITIINKLGLHARAAAKLASTAGRYSCKIETRPCSNSKAVNAKSVMSIMLLAASKGTTLHFYFDGADEAKAKADIEQLFANRFGEDE